MSLGMLLASAACAAEVMSSAHKDGKGWAGATIKRSTRNRGEIVWGAGFSVGVR